MRVLVTGGTGFTGQHLRALLVGGGHEVVGLGNDNPSGLSHYLQTDLGETERITDWLRGAQPTHIIHLAALSHVVGNALDFYRVNVLGTESLIQAIADAGISPEKIVIASSANIYGDSTSSPISEDQPIRPKNHYGLSKAAMELMLVKWFARLPIIITRPFNYTGPGQSESFVYAKIVGAFRRRDAKIRLGNINVSRDLSDVRYVAQVYQRLIESPACGVTVNICSGNSVSITDAIDQMAAIAGYRPEIEIDQSLVRADEIEKLSGDTRRLHSLVGDIPPISITQTLTDMYLAEA